MKIFNAFKLLTIFEKKAPSQMFDWVVGVWLGFETLSSLLFQVYKLSRENTQPKNMCDIVFEKNKRSWWGSKQQSKGFFKKVL